MSRNTDQKKWLEELKSFEDAMSDSDRYAYSMMVKRQKDEEDFDSLTMNRLQEMHTRYLSKRPRRNLEDLFKKPENKSGE